MKTFAYVNFKGTARILHDVNGDFSKEDKEKMEKMVLDTLNESMCYGNEDGIILENAVITFDHAETIAIMNISNGHNVFLVRNINDAWKRYNDRFVDIVSLLMKRDIEECNEKNINGDIHDYLMHVADDDDLKCILTYILKKN